MKDTKQPNNNGLNPVKDVTNNPKPLKDGAKKGVKSNKWILYKRKISSLKRRIIINIFIAIIVSGCIFGIRVYDISLKEDDTMEIKKIKKYISELEEETSEIKTKIEDAEKYKKSWENASDQQKDFSGIEIDKVNELFYQLSEKHNIISPTIKVSLPKVLKEKIYINKSIDVMLSDVVISYGTLNDIDSIGFLKDFTDSLKGYVRITKFSIKRIKSNSYTDKELISISSGKLPESIRNLLTFSWYVLKKRDPEKDKIKK